MLDTITSLFGGALQQPSLLLFFLLFFLFIIVAYKVVKMLVRALAIAVISGLFPIFANMFFGMSIPIDIPNVLWFAMTGVEIYFVYQILCGIGTIAEFFMKLFRRGGGKKVEKIIIMEKHKDKDEKEDRKK